MLLNTNFINTFLVNITIIVTSLTLFSCFEDNLFWICFRFAFANRYQKGTSFVCTIVICTYQFNNININLIIYIELKK